MEITTVNSIMTDGRKHSVDYTFGDGWYEENRYYDYATISTTIIKDGKESTTKRSEILYENCIKSREGVYFGGDKRGDTKIENWDLMGSSNPDHGKSVSFGIEVTGTTSGPIGKDFSKNAIGSISFDELQSILVKSHRVKAKSYKQMSKEKLSEWVNQTKENAEGGTKIGETVNSLRNPQGNASSNKIHDFRNITEVVLDSGGNVTSSRSFKEKVLISSGKKDSTIFKGK